jgi:DMSO/TMAO reductase YedYZ heme-binding membrane subunit
MNNISFKNQYSGGIIIITTVLSIGYAVLRYHIFGEVPWKDLPLYVLNKGISLSSLILLSFNFSLGPLKNVGIKIPENWLSARKSMGIAGFLFAFIHIFMSISILNPKYYSVFFMADGTLSIEGGLSLLGGILSFVFLWVYNTSFSSRLKEDKRIIAIITSRRFLIYAFFFTGVHLFFMGYKGWGDSSGWQGGLPPVSLISFTIFSLGFLINLIGRK